MSFDGRWGGKLRIQRNSPQNFLYQHTYGNPGEHTCNKQCRCIHHQTGVADHDHSNDQLPDIMGNASGNTDSDQAELRMLFQKIHHSEAECCSGKTIYNTEQVSKHKSNYKYADNRYKCSFPPGIPIQYKKYRQVSQPHFYTGNTGEDGDQRFYISQYNGNRSKQSKISCFSFHNLMSLHRSSVNHQIPKALQNPFLLLQLYSADR